MSTLSAPTQPEIQDAAAQRNGSVTEPPSVHCAWTAVMRDVLAVGKTGVAKMPGSGSFRFRGVDAVVDAVGPALREHGVIVVPHSVKQVAVNEYESKSGARMVNRIVKVVWRMYGPRGDYFTAESFGESSDSGDKSMSKALSVAYRVVLLQSLCIPTGDRDPDEFVHERASSDVDHAALEAANEARGELLTKTSGYGWTADKLIARWRKDYGSELLELTDIATIVAFGDALVDEAKNKPADGQLAMADDQPAARVNDHLLRKLHARLSNANITDHDEKLEYCRGQLGIPVASLKDLTDDEAEKLIAKLPPTSATPQKG